MREISTRRMPFEMIEPKWHIVEPLLDVSLTNEFTISVDLCGNLPQYFPEFSTLLFAQITQAQQQYDQQ